MLTPLPLGIGLRYVRSRRRAFGVSFLTWVALGGVCLGVAALITILSVMNGFEGELRDRLLALSAHATLAEDGAGEDRLEELAAEARGAEHVVGAAPVGLRHPIEDDVAAAVLQVRRGPEGCGVVRP